MSDTILNKASGDSEQAAGNTLSSLKPSVGSRHRRKRLGIGEGSGNGKTCGKGQKGQRMRSGFSLPAGFEGGQMPIHRRLPKVCFTSRKRVRGTNVYDLVATSALNKAGFEGVVSLDQLKSVGLISRSSVRVKLVGNDPLERALTIEVHAVTTPARKAVEGVGGQVKLV